MRKIFSFIQIMAILAMTMMPFASAAEAPFMLAGLESPMSSGSDEPLHDWDTNQFFQVMEEKTGVVFSISEYSNESDWTEVKQAMLEGDMAMPDVLFKANLTPQETQAFYDAGKLIDLRPYLEEYAPNFWALLQKNPEWLEAISLPDGAIVALPAINELRMGNTMWINKKWLERLKVDMPTTAEELTEVLRLFRDRDVNQNGDKDDEIPLTFTSMWDLRFLAHAFGINADDYYLTEKDGVISEVLTTEEFRAFLEWLHQLWEEGLLDKDGWSALRLLDSATSSSSSSSSNEAAKYGVIFAYAPNDVVTSTAMEEYVALDPLVYNGQQVYRDFTGELTRGTFAISSTCTEPETMLQWVDFLYTDEGFMLAQFGVEGVDYDWNDDGTWSYCYPADEISSYMMTNTVYEGTYMPSYAGTEVQLKLEDTYSVSIAKELERVRQYYKRPVPMLYLTEDDLSRVSELQLSISSYAEKQMTWFVAGDVELNDTTWAEFCQQVKALGMDEMVSIWQNAYDQAWHVNK